MIINPVRARFKMIPGVGSVFMPFNVASYQSLKLALESGERIRNGYVTNKASQQRPLDTPYQQIARWYGFSCMFPGREIFSANI